MVVNKPFALTAKCISYAHMKKKHYKLTSVREKCDQEHTVYLVHVRNTVLSGMYNKLI